MYSKKIKVVNPTGIHARPASQLTAKASSFRSEITLQRIGEEDAYNVKSIIMLLALGLAQGEEAILSAQGEDEVEAVDTLAEFIQDLKE